MSSSSDFITVKAIKHLNGTLDDVYKWWTGKDEERFTDFIVAFYLADSAFIRHGRDAEAIEVRQRTEEAKAQGGKR